MSALELFRNRYTSPQSVTAGLIQVDPFWYTGSDALHHGFAGDSESKS